jgi:hypothetical protein
VIKRVGEFDLTIEKDKPEKAQFKPLIFLFHQNIGFVTQPATPRFR